MYELPATARIAADLSRREREMLRLALAVPGRSPLGDRLFQALAEDLAVMQAREDAFFTRLDMDLDVDDGRRSR